MNNKLKVAGFILFFILIFIFLFSAMNVEYYKYFEGGIFSNEAEINEQVDIIFGGDIKKNIITGNVIYGTFRIIDGKYYDYEMTEENGIYQGSVYWEESEGEYVKVGKIAAPEDLDSVWAEIDDLDEKYGPDTFIAGPAVNIEEGNNIYKNIFGE